MNQPLQKQHITLVHLLGLCPLLAITNTVANGFVLGLATIGTLLISNTLTSLLRNHIPPEVRLPIFVIVIGSAVTIIDLLLEAYLHAMHGILGLFIPLIITNCVIIARAESVASKNPLRVAFADAWSTGFNFFLVLIALGTVRELIGSGELFNGFGLLVGLNYASLSLSFSDHITLPLALSPSGAFFALALLIALYKIGKTAITNHTSSADESTETH